VVDLPERARAGFAAGIWQEAPILRSAEEAWCIFRFGAAQDFTRRRAFPGLQFPVQTFDTFVQRIVPRWLGTGPLQSAGLTSVLRRLKYATVICHSQGAEIAFDALAQAPETVAGIIAVEPSSQPGDAITCPLVVLGVITLSARAIGPSAAGVGPHRLRGSTRGTGAPTIFAPRSISRRGGAIF